MTKADMSGGSLAGSGEIQRARAMIRGFGSELILATNNLPLGTYPAAIKLAAAMIDAGNVDGAKKALQTAVSTLVVTETVIPLPLVRARLLLETAEEGLENEAEPPETAGDKVAENVADEDAEAENSETMQPADYVEAARKQLAMAEALGYGTAEEHKDLRDNLEELEEKVDAGKRPRGSSEPSQTILRSSEHAFSATRTRADHRREGVGGPGQ